MSNVGPSLEKVLRSQETIGLEMNAQDIKSLIGMMSQAPFLLINCKFNEILGFDAPSARLSCSVAVCTTSFVYVVGGVFLFCFYSGMQRGAKTSLNVSRLVQVSLPLAKVQPAADIGRQTLALQVVTDCSLSVRTLDSDTCAVVNMLRTKIIYDTVSCIIVSFSCL